MALPTNTTRGVLLVALAAVLVACGKQDTPSSATLPTGSTEKTPPTPTDQASQPSDDLARIREIKEAEEADRKSAKQSEEEFRRGIKEGGARPLRDFKY